MLPVLFRCRLRLIITGDGTTGITTGAIITDITTAGIITDTGVGLSLMAVPGIIAIGRLDCQAPRNRELESIREIRGHRPNEKEISHGRGRWQGRWRPLVDQGPLASSIG